MPLRAGRLSGCGGRALQRGIRERGSSSRRRCGQGLQQMLRRNRSSSKASSKQSFELRIPGAWPSVEGLGLGYEGSVRGAGIGEGRVHEASRGLHLPKSGGAPCAVRNVGYFGPVFPHGQGDTVTTVPPQFTQFAQDYGGSCPVQNLR